MIYFSEIKGRKIVTEDDLVIGKLIDLIFLLDQIPRVTKIVFKDNNQKEQIISISCLKNINHVIKISKNFSSEFLEANELYLAKNIVDKQIIDLNGHKVVRANDVLIQDKDNYYITGVDIGILGIFRWLKLERFLSQILGIFKIKIIPNLLSWVDIQPLELARGQVKLKFKEEKLKKIKPEDLADYLETTNLSNASKILKILDEKQTIEVLNSLNLTYQVGFLKQYRPEKAALLLSLIDADEAADILMTLSTKKREQILNNMSENKKKELKHLIHLSETPIGDAITTTFITVSSKNTVKEVLDQVRVEAAEFPLLHAVYVVNDDEQLIGVFNLHELLVHDLDTPVYKFMIQNVVVIYLTTPIEIAIKKMLKYRLVSLPVINTDKKILGVVTVIGLTNREKE